MSHSEVREQLKQAQRHIDAAMKAIESASPAISPYSPRVGDVVSICYGGLNNGARASTIIVHVPDLIYGPWLDVKPLSSPNSRVRFVVESDVGRTMLFERRATPAEMAQFGLVEKDVKPAYAPEVGHLVQYCEDGAHVRHGAVIAVDGARTTIRLVNSTEAGLLDSVPRSSDYCLAFIRYATGEEMGIRVGQPSPVWMPRNYESWMLADNCPMGGRDGEKTYLVKRSGSCPSWEVEADRGFGFTRQASCDDKAQAMDVAQALAGKSLKWKRWF